MTVEAELKALKDVGIASKLLKMYDKHAPRFETGVPNVPSAPTAPSPPPGQWVQGRTERAGKFRDAGMMKWQSIMASAGNRQRIEDDVSGRYGGLVVAAVARIREARGCGIREALAALVEITDRLQASEATVNFNATQWFKTLDLSRDSYTQMFERMVIDTSEGPLFAAQQTQSGGVVQRDIAETAKFYNGFQAPRRGHMLDGAVNRFADSRHTDPYKNKSAEAQQKAETGFRSATHRGASIHVPNNPFFVGTARPRYAALNYTGCKGGAAAADAAMYGYSVLVFDDGLARKATFCAGDSFNQDVTPRTFCTHKALSAIVAWASEPLFRDLLACQAGSPTSPRKMQFIECHLYDELKFRHCLKAVRLSIREMRQPGAAANALKFWNHFGVPVQYIR